MSILKNITLFLTGLKKKTEPTAPQNKVPIGTPNPHASGGCCGHCGGQDK